MGIESFIKQVCNQTAVYWGTPAEEGYGGKTFADPVEIACRWEDVVQLIRTGQGEETISNAQVFVIQDLDEQGWLYLGNLTDLDNDQRANPKLVDRAYEIKRFDKIPALRAKTEFVRKAYL